jgi:acetyl-CoA acetyltransferase
MFWVRILPHKKRTAPHYSLSGLWDPYSDIHMGSCAEMCAAKYGITRAEQVGSSVLFCGGPKHFT